MLKTEIVVDSFSHMIKKFGFEESQNDDYIVKFLRRSIEVQLFFGRYSEQPDVFVRYEDGDKPEQFSVASMLFISEVEMGLKNSLKDADENTRLNSVIKYFEKNSDTVLSKTKCREYKSRVDDYIGKNY